MKLFLIKALKRLRAADRALVAQLRIRRKRIVVSPTPLANVERQSTGVWILKGIDPQFALPLGLSYLGSGLYSLTFLPAFAFKDLKNPSLYLDHGAGFSEATKVPLHLKKGEDDSCIATVRFPSSVYSIRLDPSDDGVERVIALRTVRIAQLASLPDGCAIQNDRIVINLTRLLPHTKGAGGAGRMVAALLAHVPEDTAIRVLIHPSNLAMSVLYPKVEFWPLHDADAETFSPHLEWCTSYFDPLNGLRPKLIPTRVRVIAMLHDLQHLVSPHFFADEERASRDLEFAYVVNRSDFLVSNSNFEVDNLRRYCHSEKSTVMHLSGFLADDALSLDPSVRATGGEAYVYPAVPWPHKNHFVVLDALRIIKARYNKTIKVILTNTGSHPDNKYLIERHVGSLAIGDQVTISDFLEENDLLSIHLNAKGLLFPSLYEGFGIPLVDAMKLGLPILASNLCAIPEVCGEAASYFQNAENAFDVAEDLYRFDNDVELRTTLTDVGVERGASFSSEKMASKLFDVLCNILPTNDNKQLFVPFGSTTNGPQISVIVVLTQNCELSSGLSEHILAIRENAGGNVKWILCVDMLHASFGHDHLHKFGRLFDSSSVYVSNDVSSIEVAIQMIQARFSCGKYQLVVNAKVLKSLTWERLWLAACALEQEPDAMYALWTKHQKGDYVMRHKSFEEAVLDFDAAVSKCLVQFDCLIRLKGPLRTFKNGSIAFLKSFTECSHIQMPS